MTKLWKDPKDETPGERLCRIRNEKHWNQSVLGKKLESKPGSDLNRWAVAQIEHDKRQMTPKDIVALCEIFHCTADFIVCKDVMPTHEQTDVHKATGLSEDSIKILGALAKTENVFSKQLLTAIDTLIRDIDPDNPTESVLLDMLFFMDTDHIRLKNLFIEYDDPVETTAGGKTETLPTGIIHEDEIGTLQLSNSQADLDFNIGKKYQGELVREYLKTRIFDKLRNIGNKKRSR